MAAMTASHWGPATGLTDLSWRDTAGQAAVRLMMELSMTKGSLREEQDRRGTADEKAATAQKEREEEARVHQQTQAHLRAAEEENEALQSLILKHKETIRRVQDREDELASEADGRKRMFEETQSKVRELRQECKRLSKAKGDAEHLAGQIADALDVELNRKRDQEAIVAEIEGRLKEALQVKERVQEEKDNLQRACSRMIRDLKSTRQKSEDASLRERAASNKLGKISQEASQMQKQLDEQARQNYALLSEKLRLHEEIRSLKATLMQRELTIRDLKEGTCPVPEAEKNLGRSPSVGGKAVPSKTLREASLAQLTEDWEEGYQDKRCSEVGTKLSGSQPSEKTREGKGTSDFAAPAK